MNSINPIKIGIVGAGRGTGQIEAIKTAGARVKLQGVYDPLPAARTTFASAHGVEKQYSDFEAAVEDCDLLVIASPQQYHAPQAAFALNAGVHVLSEVPAAVSMEQAHDLLSAARTSSAHYMMAENYCYTPENLIIAQMAKQGMFGDLYYAEGEYLHELKNYQVNEAAEATWRHRWQLGRNGVTYPTHSLGPLLQWMDDRIVAISCIGTGRWTAPHHELEDSVTLSARTRKGGLIRVRMDMISDRPELMNYYSLQGTAGAYESGRGFGDKPRLYLKGISEHEKWQSIDTCAKYLPPRYANPPSSAGHWGSDIWPLLDFLEAIEKDISPPLDIYRSLDMTLPGLISEASIAQNGTWLDVPDPRTRTAGIGINPGKEASFN